MDFEKLLNKKQLEAVFTIEGPVLLLSAAGSGKTRVITYRIVNLIEKGVNPENILAVTFTNKAAFEMKERVFNLIGNNASNILISTFHSMCAQFLRDEAESIGLNKHFSICDSQDQKNIIKKCLNNLDLDEKKFISNVVLFLISRAKDDLISPLDYKIDAEKKGEEFFIKVGEIYENYQKILEESQNLDFGDLQYKVVEMFENYPIILEKYQEKFRYIMVDEFQDTNFCQYYLIKLLSGKYKNICVVGDDDQSIYSWRGANTRNILDFEKDYIGAKSIKLEQNYRSTKNILLAADKLVKNNTVRKDKTIFTENEYGEEIEYKELLTDKEEADFVAKKILELKEREYDFNDFAIFYRTNAQSRLFEETFRKYDIPYILVGSIKFYDRKEIKDIIAYLKVILNPNDLINMRRIINLPARGISENTINLIEKNMKNGLGFFDCLLNIILGNTNIEVPERVLKNLKFFYEMIIDFIQESNELNLVDLINYILDKSGYKKYLEEDNTIYRDSRLENVFEFVSASSDYEELYGDISLDGFLQHIALVSEVEKKDEDIKKVTLMTLHLAKGLEFPVVFLTGMEEGLFPNKKVNNNLEELEEERRLCFVGITRAMKKLFCLSSSRRKYYFSGGMQFSSPSRFLFEAGIIKDKLRDIKINPYKKFDEFVNNFEIEEIDKRIDINYDNNFKKGDSIIHPNFGKGIILDIYGGEDNKTAIVRFYDGKEKRLILKYAKLEKCSKF